LPILHRAFIWSRLPLKFDIYTLLCCRLLFMYQGLKMRNIFPKPLSWQRPRFFFHYQSLIIVTTIDLSVVNNASQTGRRVAVFYWPVKVWYPSMAWTNFIDRPKTSRPWLFNQAPQNVETKIEFPRSEFHRQMANKRKERYFLNFICSIIGWYKIKVTDY